MPLRLPGPLILVCFLLLLLSSALNAQTVSLTDSGGTTQAAFYYTAPNDHIYVTVHDNSQAGSGSVNATVYVSMPPNEFDREDLILPEVSPGVFRGPSGGLPTAFQSATTNNGTAEGYNNQQLVADYSSNLFQASLEKHATASVLRLVDGIGSDKNYYMIGSEAVYIEVTDDDENDNPDAIDTITVSLNTSNGDSETLTLAETGNNTGVFTASINSSTAAVATGDGTLQVASGAQLTAAYTDDDDGSDTASDTANFIGDSTGTTFITDASGTEQATFDIDSDGIYITVYDSDENTDFGTQQSFDVTLTDGVTGDTETVTLTETTNNSGIFRNAAPGIPSAIGTASSNDGSLQTVDGSTITAEYTDPSDASDTSSDTATMQVHPVASTTRFTDSLGNDVGWYTIGANDIYITVDDADENTDTSPQTITVTVTCGATGDSVTVTLTETGGNTGVFRNTTALDSEKTMSVVADNILQTWPASTITASYTDPDDATDTSNDTASTRYVTTATINLTDAAGVVPGPDEFRISTDDVYVTVQDDDENTDSSTPETLIVTLTVAGTGDIEENITLTETGADTGVFRNTAGIFSVILAATANNGMLETTDGSQMTARYIDNDDSADNVTDTSTLVVTQSASIIDFTDAAGTAVTSYEIGTEDLYVTVDDPDENGDATTQQTITVIVSSNGTGDVETITLTETGNNTGVFRNTSGLPTAITTRADQDGTLAVGDGTIIQVQYSDDDDAGDVSNDAVMVHVAQVTSTTEVTDNTGNLLLTVEIGTGLYVTVTDADENTNAGVADTVSTTVTNTTNGDIENITLTETGNNTGVFRNTSNPLSTQLSASTTGNGVLDCSDGDNIIVTYQDDDTATDISMGACTMEYLSDSTVILTDDTGGAVVSQYYIGPTSATSAPIYIQVTDYDENLDPNAIETVYVNLYDLRTGGDSFVWSNYPNLPPGGNPVELTETTSSSGVFRSSTGIESLIDIVDINNGTLETIDGATIRATYTDRNDSNDVSQSNTAIMRIMQTTSTVDFTDAAQVPAAHYQLGVDDIYIEVQDSDENTDATIINSVTVTVFSTATGDNEQLVLTETGANTGIFFYATGLPSSTGYPVSNDGVLQTAQNSSVRVYYQDDDTPADHDEDWAVMDPVPEGAATIEFTDSAGNIQPAATPYYIGIDPVYVTVWDADQNINGAVRDSIICTITSDMLGPPPPDDVVSNIQLRETTPASGIFRNETGIDIELASSPTVDNVIQAPNGGQIWVDYEDPSDGTDTPSDGWHPVAIAPTTGVVRFTNASQAAIASFNVGSNDLYVTVWDADMDLNPTVAESVDVTIASTYTGDLEDTSAASTIQLTETGVHTGIFTGGPIPSIVDAENDDDGILQVSIGETVWVTYPADGVDHSAVVNPTPTFMTSLDFIDDSSVPGGAVTTQYYIANELIYVRLVDTDRNRSALTTESVDINITDPVNGDTVSITLYEVGLNSSTFENYLTGVPSEVNAPNTGDGILDTFAGAEIRVDYVDPENAADTGFTTAEMLIYEDSATISCTNQSGTTVTSFFIDPLAHPSLGNSELIYVTVWDADENLSASAAESIVVTLMSSVTNDIVTGVVLVETGLDTGVFRNPAGVDSEIATSNPADNILQTADLAELTALYIDSEDASDVASDIVDMHIRESGSQVDFTNIIGSPVGSYYIEVDHIYVTLEDPDQNGDAMVQETCTVTITSRNTGDTESYDLTETTSNSGIFRNIVGIDSDFDVANIGDGLVQTHGDTVLGDDILTVRYDDPDDASDWDEDTCTMHRMQTMSTVNFITAVGPAPATVATTHEIRNDLILVEVHDDDENADPGAIDVVHVTVTSPGPTGNPANDDYEVLDCYETGNNTGYFQTLVGDGIYSDIAPVNAGDSTLQVTWPSDIVVTYVDNDYRMDQSSHTIPTTMFQTNGSLWFCDNTGTAVTTYGIGTDLIYVCLDDEDRNHDYSTQESVVVTLYETTTADTLTLTLYENGVNSSVFWNISVTGVASVVGTSNTSDDIIQTADGSQLYVTYQDPANPAEMTTDIVDMELRPTTSTVRFLDLLGNTTTWYTIQWHDIYVEVTDIDENHLGSVQETVMCTITDPSTGDTETVTCTEITSSAGVFRSTSLPTRLSGAGLENGIFETQDNSLITVTYQDIDNPPMDISTSQARMFVASSNSNTRFLDAPGGLVAPRYYFGDNLYVEVEDYDENTSPVSDQSVRITITCTASGDVENLLVLPEYLGPDSDFFINTTIMPVAQATTGTPNNGVIEGMHGQVIQADYVDDDNPPSQPYLDHSWTTAVLWMPQTGANVEFTDSLGNIVPSYLIGRQNVYVTVWDADQNYDTSAIDSVTVTIETSDPNFDQLVLTLQEIGLNAGVFRNQVAVLSEIATTATTTDNVLQVREEAATPGIDEVNVIYTDPDDGTDVTSSTVDFTYRSDAVVAFTDAAGTTMTTFVIGVDDIYITLWDMDQNLDTSARDTVVVTVTADYNGDTEYVLLQETGVDTGVFRNTNPRNSVYAQTPTSFDSIIQTIAASSPPPEEFIEVDYIDPMDPSDWPSETADVIPRDRNDRDGDGIPNSYEDSYGSLDPDDPSDAQQDADGDGRTNILEYIQGTDPEDASDNLPVADPGWYPALDPSLVELDASASYDASTHPPTGIVAYEWTQTGGPVTVTISDPHAINPTWVGRTDGVYTFELRVRDADGAEDVSPVSITINDVAPIAEVIAGATIDLGSSTLLEGRGCTEANDQALTYTWMPNLSLDDNSLPTPLYTPAAVGVRDYTLNLQDSAGNFAPVVVETVITHDPANFNYVPTADAGPDLAVTVSNWVQLDWSNSSDYDDNNGNPLVYVPNVSVLSGAGGFAWDTVTPPYSPSRPGFNPSSVGVYRIELRVQDVNLNQSAPDYAYVTVNAPSGNNHVPTANAGDDGFGAVFVEYTLDGSASSDSDGNALVYQWTQVRGERTPLSDTTTSTPSFTPIAPGVYEWELQVTDSDGNASIPDRVSVIVNGSANTVPIANAGVDQTVTMGSADNILFTLDGSASADADGDPLTYYWRQTMGTSSSLDNYRSETPSMLATHAGVYEFELTVYDGENFSKPDRVIVQVVGDNEFPVADAGPDASYILHAVLGTVDITLDGSGSHDPDNQPNPALSYQWTQTGGPAVTLSDATAVQPTFTADTAGEYTFTLRVDDGELWDEDVVVIRVSDPGDTVPVADAGPDQIGVYIDNLVTLDGTGSYDPDLDPFSYIWIQTAGPASVVLSNATIAQPTFVPRIKGVYTFRLRVSGDDGSSDDTVNIYVYGGQAGNGGGTGGGTVLTGGGGGGGGGCSAAPDSASPHPVLLLLLLSPAVMIYGKYRLKKLRERVCRRKPPA